VLEAISPVEVGNRPIKNRNIRGRLICRGLSGSVIDNGHPYDIQ
jgi:hypothetical protein